MSLWNIIAKYKYLIILFLAVAFFSTLYIGDKARKSVLIFRQKPNYAYLEALKEKNNWNITSLISKILVMKKGTKSYMTEVRHSFYGRTGKPLDDNIFNRKLLIYDHCCPVNYSMKSTR